MKNNPRKEQNVEKQELEKSELLCFLFLGLGPWRLYWPQNDILYVTHCAMYTLSPKDARPVRKHGGYILPWGETGHLYHVCRV